MSKVVGIKPVDGFVRNPLMDFPRNEKCVCGSGKKWKKCCHSRSSRYVPAHTAKIIMREILSENLTDDKKMIAKLKRELQL